MYLLLVGGSSSESGVTVEGIGQAKVEHLLYRTLTMSLGKSSDFLGFRFGLRNHTMCFAENGEYDFSYEDCGSVLNAMAAVGVGAPDRDSDCFDDEVDICPCVYNPDQDPAACEGNIECGPQCEQIRECGECGAEDGCGWCDGSCESTTDEASCSGGSFETCDDTNTCGANNTCLACANATGCGWCNGACQSDASDCLNPEGREVPYTHAEVCCGALTTCGDCMADGCSWCEVGEINGCTYQGDRCPNAPVLMCEANCESLSNCATCAATEGCGWGSIGCEENLLGGIGLTTNPTDCEATDPCSVGTDCEMCAQTAGCGWGAEGCVTASPGSPDVITRSAECYDCSGLTSCTPCASNGFCDWCDGSGCHNTYENACEEPTPVLVCAIVELPD